MQAPRAKRAPHAKLVTASFHRALRQVVDSTVGDVVQLVRTLPCHQECPAPACSYSTASHLGLTLRLPSAALGARFGSASYHNLCRVNTRTSPTPLHATNRHRGTIRNGPRGTRETGKETIPQDNKNEVEVKEKPPMPAGPRRLRGPASFQWTSHMLYPAQDRP